MWFEKYGFKQDPYTITDAFRVPMRFLEWNRDDLSDAAWKSQTFVDRASEGYRVGLGIYGPVGSGKTWLLRITEKRLKQKLGDRVLVIRTWVPKPEPNFGAVYELFIESILDQMESILSGVTKAIAKKMKTREVEVEQLKKLIGEEGWLRLVGEITPDRSLAACLWNLALHQDDIPLCEQWLKGERIPARDLIRLKLTTNLDRDFRKLQVMKSLIELGLYVYKTVVLFVDELENARPMVASIIGDCLRDLLDSFAGNFSLVCSYSGLRADELLDLGYREWLYSP